MDVVHVGEFCGWPYTTLLQTVSCCLWVTRSRQVRRLSTGHVPCWRDMLRMRLLRRSIVHSLVSISFVRSSTAMQSRLASLMADIPSRRPLDVDASAHACKK